MPKQVETGTVLQVVAAELDGGARVGMDLGVLAKHDCLPVGA